MNRNNGAQSSCVLLTMIISGCQHCWLWGFKIFPAPTQTSLLFPSFPSANRTQAASHYREACPLVFYERVSQIFYNLVCAYRHAASFLQHFVDLCSKHLDKDGIWPHRGHLVQLDTLYFQRRGSLLSTDCGKVLLLGWAFLKPAESPLQWSPVAPLNITFLWAKPAPCLLFPTYSVSCSLNLRFEVSGFEQSQNLSWNLTPLWQPLPYSLSVLGGTICGVCGFEPAIGQVSHASLSTEVSSHL